MNVGPRNVSTSDDAAGVHAITIHESRGLRWTGR